jgi:hypothetical protein
MTATCTGSRTAIRMGLIVIGYFHLQRADVQITSIARAYRPKVFKNESDERARSEPADRAELRRHRGGRGARGEDGDI